MRGFGCYDLQYMSGEEKDGGELHNLRHSLAHLLAAAVLDIRPDAKPTIGPAIENGFYYDFDFVNTDQHGSKNGSTRISEEDLPKIEAKMRELLSSWETFAEIEVGADEAKEFFKDNPYKLELIGELEKSGERITLYYSGPANEAPIDFSKIVNRESNIGFVDLCRGGHVENPSKDIDPNAFALSKVAGAYWRGDENNKMLTRIYGLAFANKGELDEHLRMMEEAAKRDHRKLGRELDLFTFSDLVGAGLPLFTPKGASLRNALQDKLVGISRKYGMQPVTIPHIAKRALYETSGHASKFGDELLKVVSHYDEFVMKPVNCPHHTQIYASKPRSYRDLPIRYMESTMQYRDEKPGEIGGLTRVRAITVDDGHIFCTIDQIKEEASNLARIIEEFYTDLGLFGSHWVSLSVRDPNKPENYIGDDEGWQKAEDLLASVSDELNLEAKRVEGEAAIYGPKLDYMFKDSLGREWQLATIQVDFAMPGRFGLEYTADDGQKKTPVMIHRAILGSYERFMAILIEHFAGKFPLWLSPVQVKVLPIGESQLEYAKDIEAKLKEAGLRVELDRSEDTLGKKIRNAKTEKVPYYLVIGDNEAKNGTVTLEGRDEGKVGELSAEEVIARLSS